MFRGAYRVGLVTAAAAVFLAATPSLFAQAANKAANVQQPAVTTNGITNTGYGYGYYPQPPVGGIAVDADGVLSKATVDAEGKAAQARAEGFAKVPAELNQAAGLRKVSLRRVEAVAEGCIKDGKPLPDEIKLLGGLQRIEYVLVYPEQRDIVLAGPGEGWKLDKRGNVVGVTTGRPVMLLDDLVVALRTARQAAQGGITCSIDPTAEGRARLQAYVSTLRTMGDLQTIKANIEQSLGPERITFTNVPTTSHFARVLLAADYQMKRLAMEFEPAPIRGLPGYLHMIPAGSKGMSNLMQRWWLEPQYEGVFRDARGLAWELRGGSVKCMTEEDFLTSANVREHTGKASAMAQKWANNMTAKYDELAVAEPIFGDLRNCMELAVVGALLVKENLPGKAGYSMPLLMSSSALATGEYPAPKQVDSKASFIRKGGNWVFSVSGGVAIQSWAIAAGSQESDAPAAVRSKAVPAADGNWCSN
jgi:hypothetical protein